MSTFIKIVASLCTFIYCVGVPILEINSTHVFSPEWSPHARIHEVWQLLTNSSLGLIALYTTWHLKKPHIAALVGMIITGSFLVAYVVRGEYGGSMSYLDGTEKLVLGMNLGLFGFGLTFLVLLIISLTAKKYRH